MLEQSVRAMYDINAVTKRRNDRIGGYMEVLLDCLPCSMRQLLDAARMSTNDEQLQTTIMDEGIALIASYNQYRNSPELCRAMHSIVKKHTGNDDPYKPIKDRDIVAALKLYPMLKQYVEGGDRLHRALKVSATGNLIDSAVNSQLSIESCVQHELQKPFAISDETQLRKQLKKAKTLLFVGDNAGETVFDRVLLESLPPMEIRYAVRSKPTINDATAEEAIASGLSGCAHIILSGSDMPGINMDEATEEFQKAFWESDIVICKGQGNFETLPESGRDAFFLLKAKCQVLSRLLGVGLGDYVFRYLQREAR